MLKRLTAWLLIFTVLSANYSRLFVYAGFELNQKYIAAKLCENRNKPWMHCNGRCYLMKKLKQLNEKQTANQRETQRSLFQEGYFATTGVVKFYTSLLQTYHFSDMEAGLSKGYLSIFRPPQLG
ncbi:MAG: hypothetical protein JSU01_09420 [Bacteroidetes bacterium]|nr:hypothetical protein [Bacteroidota bacterium]